MRLSTLSCGLMACIVPLISATALTYKLAAHEKACFYADVQDKGAKIAFYFAVRLSLKISYFPHYL
jgi:ubiquitin carboxyl-terminal hydrolase 7